MFERSLAGILLMLAVTGCGNGEEDATPSASLASEPSSAAPSAAVRNVCSLASNEEIGAATGNEVVGVDVDPTLCEYAPTTGTLGRDRIAVDVFRNEASDSTCDLEFRGVSATNGQPVDELGDLAYWRGDRASPQLYICGVGWFVAITLYAPASTPPEQAAATAREIGTLVLSRL